MLDLRANSIEYAAQTALVTEVTKLVTLHRQGKHTKASWNNYVEIGRYLEVLSQKDNFEEEQLKSLTYIYECLIQRLYLNRLPANPGSVAITIPDILVGIPGSVGPAGASAYLYFAWADDNTGTGFVTTYSPLKPYLAFIQSSSPILALTSAMFAGRWIKIIGDDGVNGNDGAAGSNGTNGTNGNSVLSGSSNPLSGVGVDGDFYINTSSWEIFGPKASGTWPGGISIIGPDGIDGDPGADGNSILSGVGAPSGGTGQDGDFYIDINDWDLYGPKTTGAWTLATSLIGPTGAVGSTGSAGTAGVDGANAYVYTAYADDASGTNYILVSSNDVTASLTTFDSTKKWISWYISSTAIGTTITATQFAGRWAKYAGDGDRWSTFSSTSLTIGIGTQNLVVEMDLAYVTGQRVVIALDNDPTNLMEGYTINYNPTTGQLSVDIDSVLGSGTYNQWDVSLQTSLPNTTEFAFANTDVDTGTEDIDTFSTALAQRVEWEYVIVKGVNSRGGVITAARNGTTMIWSDTFPPDFGTVDIDLDVDVSGGNIRLRAVATSDDWTVKGLRRIIAI